LALPFNRYIFGVLPETNRAAVERFFGWLKLGFRRIATRHERLDACFMGFILLAAFFIIWRKV